MEENDALVREHANRKFTDAELGLLREGLEYGPGGPLVRIDMPWAVGVDDGDRENNQERAIGTKSPSFQAFLSRFSLVNFGVDPQLGRCPFCGEPVDPDLDNGEFRDDLSRKECRISGLCQSCQDTVFGVQDSVSPKAEVYIPYI